MPTKYGHLRLVSPDEAVNINEPIETKPEPTWDQVPNSLAETAAVVLFLPTNETDLDNLDVEKIEIIVHNLQTALETLNQNWLADLEQFTDWEKIFSVLASARTLLSETNPTLAADIFTLQQQAVRAIAELGKQNEISKDANENKAFIYLLRLLAAAPEFTTITEPLFSAKKSAPLNRKSQETGLLEWVEHQKTIDRIGQVAGTSESLAELLHLLAQVPETKITTHRTADFSTSHSLSSIISFINTEIKRLAISPDESLAEITKKHQEVERLAANSTVTGLKNLFPPDLGFFKTRAFVYRELDRELKNSLQFDQIESNNVDSCKSWVQLMWLIESNLESTHEFVFTVHIGENTEQIVRLSGETIKDIVEQAPLDASLISILPKQSDLKFIRPNDRVLVGLREKLNSFFD